MKYFIRPVEEKDNLRLAVIIKKNFSKSMMLRGKEQSILIRLLTTSVNCSLNQNRSFGSPLSNNEPIGCCGIYPSEGLPVDCAELVKFYLSADARGKEIGKELMHKSITSAIELGYRQLYLESLPFCQSNRYLRKRRLC